MLDDLVDGLSAAERARLQRVRELLIETGPPPELPPRLARPPGEAPPPEVSVLLRAIPRRRLAASLVLAAAIAAAVFGAGYLVGGGGESTSPVAAERFVADQVVTLRSTSRGARAAAVVGVGKRENGNLPLILTVEGLDRLPFGDYYILYMTKNGKPAVICGTFNVPARNERTEFEFTVAYDLADFEGFALVEYRRDGHRQRTLMTGKLT